MPIRSSFHTISGVLGLLAWFSGLREEFVQPTIGGSGCRIPRSSATLPQDESVGGATDFVVTATPNYTWSINAAINPTLTLERGQTYSLDLSSVTNEHPFLINSEQNNPFGTIYLPSSYGGTILSRQRRVCRPPYTTIARYTMAWQAPSS